MFYAIISVTMLKFKANLYQFLKILSITHIFKNCQALMLKVLSNRLFYKIHITTLLIVQLFKNECHKS